MWEAFATGAVVAGAGVAAAWTGLRRKGLHRWLGEYVRTRHLRRDYVPGEPLEIVVCVCDHFEPKRGGVPPAKAKARVQQWVDEYPKLFDRYRDSFDRPPQHTFFYPADEYEPEYLDMLAGLCRRGYGDVEVHLHHDNDTAENLRRTLIDYKTTLHDRHGLLRKDPQTGEIIYAFIHGDWALDNSRSDGRHCGVDNELDVLVETGCYADFTMPSAPSETQTRRINSIYWAKGRPGQRKSHDDGVLVGQGAKPPRGLLMVQGPLLLDWSARKWGVVPGIENGNLQKNQPPTEKRVGHWLRARVELPGSESRVLVKLHTHGCHEPNQDVLLGPAMSELHESLASRRLNEQRSVVRYATAHELSELILAVCVKQPEVNELSKIV